VPFEKKTRCKHGHILRWPDGRLSSRAYVRPDSPPGKEWLQCGECRNFQRHRVRTASGRYIRKEIRW